MRDDQMALALMLVGFGCILAWAVCTGVAAIRAHRIRRQADVIKLHIVKGGELPDGTSSTLAENYLRLRWLGIVGNVLLIAGIAGMVLAQFVIQ